MSRCFPYPPPGYEKKPQLIEVAPSPKKDERKQKHNDKKKKKKKRRKDGEANGDSSHRDKDKRSKRAQQQHAVIDKGITFANGKLSSAAAAEPKAITSVSGHGTFGIQSQQPDRIREIVRRDGSPTLHKEKELQLSSVPQARTHSNGSAASNIAVPISKPSSHIEGEVDTRGQEQEAHVSRVEKAWPAIEDDEEWLFLYKPLPDEKRNSGEGEGLEVWAEVLYLPAVGIHALPYVVPD